jgi:alpha-N-arabinofuranosidase
VHISLANLNPARPLTLTCPIIGETYRKVSAEVLTAATMNAMNTFDNGENVKPRPFTGFKYRDGVLSVSMPPKSVIVLELSK